MRNRTSSPVGPGKERRVRFVFSHVILQRLLFVIGNVRRVAGHDIELLVRFQRAKQVAGQKANSIGDRVGCGVVPRDGEGRLARVGGRDLRVGQVDGGRDRDAAGARAESRIRGAASGLATSINSTTSVSVSGRGIEHGRRHAEVEAEEFAVPDQVSDRLRLRRRRTRSRIVDRSFSLSTSSNRV